MSVLIDDLSAARAHHRAGRLAEAEAAFGCALDSEAAPVGAWVELANVRWRRGDAAGTAACYRRLMEFLPGSPVPHSDYLQLLLYDPGTTAGDVYREAVRWGERHGRVRELGSGELGVRGGHDNDRTPERLLRVGYVSGDLREHPIGRFMRLILGHHDRAAVVVYCYSHAREPDALTEEIRSVSCAWRDTRGWSAAEIAEQVRRDRIDVLVDLTGHMGEHRLQAFALRPAPVQVSYLAWPATTGLPAIQYRLTDAWHDPPGMTEQYHTEQLVRLGRCCWCFAPGDAPDVNNLPALTNGHVTFGALNRLVKVTAQAIRLWARILAAVPRSKLLVLVDSPVPDPAIPQRFASGGVDPSRLIFANRRARPKYLGLFHRADLLLDTFPYAGMTTTCDGMWMGVPTVTLAGTTHVSRTGVSLLSAVGLPELVAQSGEEYVRIAVEMATDLPRLAELRRGLRERMRHSPLMDGPSLARELEAAYRTMWRKRYDGSARMVTSP